MRKIGCRDRRPRKLRSDRGKKRRLYNQKPCKHRPKRFYQKKIGNKQFIKIWIWRIERMSYDGYRNWHRNIRRRVNQEVWIPQNRDHVYLVPVNEINTREKLCQFVCDRYYQGTWAVMGFTNKKNKYHCSPRKKARIVIKETETGNVVSSFKDYGLYRYWFWR
jgi:hypothetical protein